jgi:hypothetical protein
VAHVERFSEANFIRSMRKAALPGGDPVAKTVLLKLEETLARPEAVRG